MSWHNRKHCVIMKILEKTYAKTACNTERRDDYARRAQEDGTWNDF